VQTDTIAPGADLNNDGIPDAWEYQNFGTTNINVNADADGDHQSNLQEYLAGTNPNDPNSYLRITAYATAPAGATNLLTWTSVATRLYHVQESLNLASPNWYDSGLGLISPDGAFTTRNIADTNAPIRFYRVQAVKPLSP
jgi:hypothetical protein